MAHKFNPAHADRLLEQQRKEWNDPEIILRHLNLGPSTVMADVGCGPGWFAVDAARRTQPNGLVYGIDVSEEMLARLSQRAEAEGLANLKGVLATDGDEYPIPSKSVDAVLIANVYHEVDPASNFLGEIKRLMKGGGTCLVVDWKPEQTPSGPPLTERLSPADVIAEFQAASFKLVDTCEVGPYHYGLRFVRPHEGDA